MNKHRIENCPFRRNVKIRNMLVHKFAARGMSQKDVVDDAREFGMPLTREVLSSYINSFDPVSGKPIPGRQQPAMETLLWLCARYGIEISIEVKPVNLSEADLRQRARDFNPKTFIKKKR